MVMCKVMILFNEGVEISGRKMCVKDGRGNLNLYKA